MRPKVLQYLDTGNYAGTEAHILTLLQALDSDLYSSALLCRPHSPLHQRAQAAGVACYPAGGVSQMIPLLRRERFDLIHAHDGNSKLRAIVAAQMAGVGTQVIATQHFVCPAYARRGQVAGRFAAGAHRLVNRRIAAHIAVSQAVRAAALARREAQDAQVTVIPNGILFPAVPLPNVLAAKRAELGIPAAVPLIATVARLSPEKGIEHLLHAFPRLHSQQGAPHLLLIGEGALRDALERESVQLGLQERVHFTGFRNDVLDLVAAAEIFALPSLAEPFGLALVEAMALGKPVVAVRAGGPLEIVADNTTGLLVNPADPHSLAEALQRLLDQPELAERMGKIGQKRMAERFSAEAMARKTEEVYQRCLADLVA